MVSTEVAGATAPKREARIGGRRYPVVLPSARDPRLRVAAVILSIHALGQGPLHFDVSIAQILCSLLVCAALEVGIVFVQRKAIVWPASALLTGSGVALLLRIPGTEHGDWFSLNGIHIVAATAALSLLTKYVLRVRGYQLFNPSNIGLVVCFLVLGSQRVDPQDLWWGPTNAGLVIAIVIIVVGGLWITWSLRLIGLAAAFWLTFASGVAVNSASGHCMTARWSFEPVCDSSYFTTVALSPEVLIFLFFMITDPRTTPRGRVARTVFGALVGVVAGLLVASQGTEFATKVGILAALIVVCVARPLVERLCPAPGAPDDHLRTWIAPPGTARVRRVGRATALVILPMLAYLVWVVGLDQRFGDEDTTGRIAAGAPPAAIGDVVLPPIELDPNAERIGKGFDLDAARAAAIDLVEDLEIEIRAVQQRDPALAMSSSSGTRLDDVLRLIAAAPAGRDATLPTYRFTKMRAVLSRESPQAQPKVRFETTATIILLRADGTLGATIATDATVVISLVDGPNGAKLIAAAM
jgi:Na+-translocating ferredoxin:NAD+ oxidoreductase RnfD subunit